MHQIEAEFTFAAATACPRYSGKCFNLHGHNYRFQVVLRGDPDPYTGIFVDFSEVENLVKEHVLDRVDHTKPERLHREPTAENIASWMWHRLEGKLPGLVEIRLWEIPTSCVVYRGPAREVVNGASRSQSTAADRKALAKAIEDLLLASAPARCGNARDPARVAKAFSEDLLDGYARDAIETLKSSLVPAPRRGELVIASQIDFHAMCPHHLLPYKGSAAVGTSPTMARRIRKDRRSDRCAGATGSSCRNSSCTASARAWRQR